MLKEYWVWAECRGGCVDPSVFALLAKARQLAADTTAICAIVVADPVPSPDAFGGADILRFCKAEGSAGRKATILAEMATQYHPEIVLFFASPEESQVAAQAAALLDTGLSADCADLFMEGDNLVMRRPAFGGGITADILCPSHRPQMATVRPGAFPAAAFAEVMPIGIQFEMNSLPEDKVRCLTRTIVERKDNLREARIIVSGGLGVGSRADYGLIEDLAAAMKGLPGASRAAVDAGFARWDRQIGQTGSTVYPDLYLAFGISGSIQHIAGMHGARFIAAVNTDPKAPIFDYSDLAVTADWRMVAESLLHAFT